MAGDGSTAKSTRATSASANRRRPAGTAPATAQAATAKAAKAAEAAEAVAKPARKAAGTVRATRAARSGRAEEAKAIAADADLGDGVAGRAIAESESLHYQVEVNKRALSVNGLTKTLNDRWDNGWRLAHIIEQRGNTVLVFERRL
ncbi:MAG TPA: hypothetical protein VFO65_13125 [Acidimicrobiales bacterium]|nr:hypothetical protein [Acidimicrobiales bacterium]